jgi:hypothetical protein
LNKKRALALVAAAAAVFPFVVASPSYANDIDITRPVPVASNCRTLLAGPTPSVEVDTNNDGNPEARVPSLTNARLCVFGDVQLYDSPNMWSEACNFQGTCQRFFIHYGVDGTVGGSVQLCYYLDGLQTCAQTRPVSVPITSAGGTMCIGVDAGGGRPCGGGTSVVSFS